ncbi:MAG: tRNA (adenosine(37)-N6)-threonylcarbamoyltransferase complex ATPase subunit type 1 TsaE, partial [Thermotogota bacterium]|nr:tRNA (adenosine(37)-N6)-threonylcarbamoyltransferase complex ATPase subunit type 1 TsaE [Thermotogota bacterium]
ITYSATQTKSLGQRMSPKILKSKDAVVVSLEGDLGSGKTTFVQGLAMGLGIKNRILSPTFVLMKKYKIPNTKKQFYHIDCYRIKKASDLSALNLEKLFLNPQNIIAIEWAERIKKILPKNTIIFKFKFIKEKQREIITELC